MDPPREDLPLPPTPRATSRVQISHHDTGRRSLPPAVASGSQHVFHTYPSSTLHTYYNPAQNVANYAHISSSFQPVHSFSPSLGNPTYISNTMPLPSASQSHIPSLRRTPSVSPEILRTNHVPTLPFHDSRNDIPPYNSQHIHSRISQRMPSRTSQRANFPSPNLAAPQPIPLPANPVLPPPTTPFPPLIADPLPHAPLPADRFTHTPLPHHHLPRQHLHYTRLPPQYTAPVVNHPAPTQISYLPSSLPSTKDVPILTGKHDWGPWHSAVRTLTLNANLLGHISDNPLPGAIFDPGLWPTYPPVIHQHSTQPEIQAFTDWWSRDGLASHILTSRLSSAVLGSLPIANERMGHRRSARTVYNTLRHQYGAGDYSAVMLIEARLRQLRCMPSRGGVKITDFINTWRTSLSQMEAAGFLPGIRQLLYTFADGLPNNTVAFVNLYDHIISSLNEPHEQSLPNIHHLFDRTIQIDNNIQRTRILHSNPRRPLPPTPTTAPSVPPTSAAVSPVPNPQGDRSSRPTSTLYCSNCGRSGHTGPNCFQPGGAMEGRREEYLASRAPRPIAHIAEIEENQSTTEEGIVNVEENSLNTEFAAMSLGDTNEIQFSTYVLASFPELPIDQNLALSSISQTFNSALDSACTNHIFRDRDLFHMYDAGGAMPVKTANCGLLTTLGIGDVKINLTINNKTIVWTLRNCLHAPTVPINLISVGALQEHHMSVTFSFQKTTISFPPSHPHLSGLSFDAHVTRRLSLLNLNFILPSTLPVALHLFPIAPNSPEVWHRRFGHLGHEASKNVLNGHYVTGITKPSIPYPLTPRCIPFLIGKSPQAPYAHNAKRSSAVGDLIHIDTCGPFPTLTPKKEAFFTIFLDDASNFGVTTLLSAKSGAFQAWKKVEASWELTSGNHIKAVRFDGAKEFTQGPFSAHLLSRGITMQVTAPYAHAQAGKAERYVRTIEDGIQTLLADAKLPPSFWGDAVLTVQNLRNRLPTSTLPSHTTPYEVMYSTKLDLSHLRIWGCQCFPAIPPELRTKGGPRCYKAIFVGYEDN